MENERVPLLIGLHSSTVLVVDLSVRLNTEQERLQESSEQCVNKQFNTSCPTLGFLCTTVYTVGLSKLVVFVCSLFDDIGIVDSFY